MKSTFRLSLLMLTCLLVVTALASCMSASYRHREYYPPTVPVVKAVAYHQGEYQPSANHGPIKSDTEIKGQDSTKIIDGTGGIKGGLDGLMSFATSTAGGGMLKGIVGSTGVGAVVLTFLQWRHGSKLNAERNKTDALYDEGYNKGFAAGVAARGAA